MNVNWRQDKLRLRTIEPTRSQPIESAPLTTRRIAPVFVVGCPRSGTTLLYHMLSSAGGFANYRSESNVFNLLGPKFGGLRSIQDRQAVLNVWLRSKLFRVSNLDPGEISARITSDCHSAGDFLQIVMQEVARAQGATRWADCTPEHLLYMREIKRQIPNALFIHIIRDGRDVALSYVKQGWSHPLPWDRNDRLEVAGLYWAWLIHKGREQAKYLGADYCEIRFEDLVTSSRQTLSQLSTFIDHDLDYEKIQRTGIGSVKEPNTSFPDDGGASFNPVGRWKDRMPIEQVVAFERIVGNSLSQLGYELTSPATQTKTFHDAWMSAIYPVVFEAKHWARTKTPLGRLVRLERIEVEQ
jgi:hypothetical protein